MNSESVVAGGQVGSYSEVAEGHVHEEMFQNFRPLGHSNYLSQVAVHKMCEGSSSSNVAGEMNPIYDKGHLDCEAKRNAEVICAVRPGKKAILIDPL